MIRRKSTGMIFIAVLSIAGLLFSYILAQHHYYDAIYLETGEKLSVFSQFSSYVCGDNSLFISCAKVEESAFSVFLNVPVASWGIIFFLIMLFTAILFFFVKEDTIILHDMLLSVYLSAGTAVSAALFCISLFIIKALCPLCLSVYITVIISLIIFIFHLKKSYSGLLRFLSIIEQKVLNDAAHYLKYIPIFILSILAAVLIGLGSDRSMKSVKEDFLERKEEAKLTRLAETFCSQMPVNMNIKPYCIIGNRNAPVVITEFSDFMCPSCADAADLLKDIIKEYPSQVLLVFVNFPLDTSCNSYIRNNLHPGSCALAKGALCASMQGRFAEYMNAVFSAHVEQISPEYFAQLASTAGLDLMAFSMEIKKPSTEKLLLEQIMSAGKLGITGTPTLFINDKMFKNKPSKRLLRKIIDIELKMR